MTLRQVFTHPSVHPICKAVRSAPRRTQDSSLPRHSGSSAPSWQPQPEPSRLLRDLCLDPTLVGLTRSLLAAISFPRSRFFCRFAFFVLVAQRLLQPFAPFLFFFPFLSLSFLSFSFLSFPFLPAWAHRRFSWGASPHQESLLTSSWFAACPSKMWHRSAHGKKLCVARPDVGAPVRHHCGRCPGSHAGCLYSCLIRSFGSVLPFSELTDGS